MKPHILLIEDDAVLQMLLFDLLSFAEYDVSVAMPHDYLFMVQEVRPDVLVLGCDGDYTFDRGWKIAATLHRQYPDLVMIMLSTNIAVVQEVGRSTRGLMFAAGLQKPFAVDDLLQTIGNTHEQRHTQHSSFSA
jgi:DNA-binding NtrC family response regulator